MSDYPAQTNQTVPLAQPSTRDFTLEYLAPSCAADTLDAAKSLLLEYGHFVAAHPSVASFCFGALEQEVANLPYSYLDQNGGAILASTNNHPVGFVAWRCLPASELASAWELKRLWLRPQARGLGIGRALVQEVLDRAKANGKSIVLLDTAPKVMSAAHGLYLQMGFAECPPYNGRPLEGIVYMRKCL
jgi:putative acetyltransferase